MQVFGGLLLVLGQLLCTGRKAKTTDCSEQVRSLLSTWIENDLLLSDLQMRHLLRLRDVHFSASRPQIRKNSKNFRSENGQHKQRDV